VSDVTKSTDDNVTWYVSRLLGLVAQVKAQARGLRRYKRRVERLRREMERLRMGAVIHAHIAATWMLDRKGGASDGCLFGDCAHSKKVECVNAITAQIDAAFEQFKAERQAIAGAFAESERESKS